MASGKMFQSVRQPLPVGRRGAVAGKDCPASFKKRFLQTWRECLQRQGSPSGENSLFVRNEVAGWSDPSKELLNESQVVRNLILKV